MRGFFFGMGVTMATTMFVYALWVALFVSPAYPHGDAEWILSTPYRACCGKVDCKIVHVTFTGTGWVFKNPFLEGVVESVPDDGGRLPSIDDHYWACFNINGDKRLRSIPTPGEIPSREGARFRCFFTPEAGS